MDGKNRQPHKFSSVLKDIKPKQSLPNWVVIVVTVLITGLIVGWGVYAWQRSILKAIESKQRARIKELKDKVEELRIGLRVQTEQTIGESLAEKRAGTFKLKETKLGFDFWHFLEFKEIDNIPVYTVKTKNKVKTFYGSQQLGEKYFGVGQLTKVGESFAFSATDDREKSFERDLDIYFDFVVYQGKEYGRRYNSASSPTEVNGKLAYKAREKASVFIVYNGEEKTGYTRVSGPLEIGGKLAYTVFESSCPFVVYDSKPVGSKYSCSSLPTDVGGKLVYAAEAGGSEFIVYRGEEGERYKKITFITEVGEKPAYVAGGGDREFVVHNGKKEKNYRDISYIADINGVLAYKAQKENFEWVIVYKDREIGVDYEFVSIPVEIDGKLAFVAEKENNLGEDIWYLIQER